MAITASVLTSGWSTTNNTGPTAYSTASVSPAANAVLVLVVAYTGTGAQPDPTISGLGLTWEEFTSSEAARTVAIWRAKGTGSTGAISIAPPTSHPYTSCYWVLVEVLGADLDQAIGQVAVQNGSGTAASVSLADAPAAGAVTIAGFLQSVDTTTTPRTDWTEAADIPGTAPVSTLQAQYKVPGEQTASATFAASGNWRAVLVSVREATASTPNEGSASGTFTFAGSASGARTPKGSASGSFVFAGSATGVRTPEGAATGDLAWTGSATGSAPAVGSNEGSASGTFTFTGAVTGVRTPEGASSGSFTFTGAATGVRAPVGQASGDVAFVGAATGSAPTGFSAPTGLSATPITDDRIDLSWNPVTGATGYDVERDGVVVATDVATTSYSDTGLDPLTEYDYRVRAVG